MPKPWAILVGILIGLIILWDGIRLMKLSVVLLPLYYAGRNLVYQGRRDGIWTMRWPKFWLAFLLQFVVIGVPAYVIIMNEPHSKPAVFLLIAVYFIINAVAYGVAKK